MASRHIFEGLSLFIVTHDGDEIVDETLTHVRQRPDDTIGFISPKVFLIRFFLDKYKINILKFELQNLRRDRDNCS